MKNFQFRKILTQNLGAIKTKSFLHLQNKKKYIEERRIAVKSLKKCRFMVLFCFIFLFFGRRSILFLVYIEDRKAKQK